MTGYALLLRGVNVGRAKRLAMSDLRTLLEGLDCRDVRTVLNSGNAVFRTTAGDPQRLAASVESAVRDTLGLSAAAIAITAARFDAVVAANPLSQAVVDPARFLVAFAPAPAVLDAAAPLLERDWSPEALAVVAGAAYLWCPGGIAGSKLVQGLARATADAITTRNWSTVLRIQSQLDDLGAG